MRMTELRYDGPPPVEGYGPGFFRLGGRIHRGAILTGPGGTGAWAGPAMPPQEMTAALGGAVDLVLIGCGTVMTPLPAALRAALEAAGIAAEPMNTPAACRTYNVLLAEGRRVALAALPV